MDEESCLSMNRSAGLRPGAFQNAGYFGRREESKTRYLVSYGRGSVCAAHCMVEPRQVHPRSSVAKSVSPPQPSQNEFRKRSPDHFELRIANCGERDPSVSAQRLSGASRHPNSVPVCTSCRAVPRQDGRDALPRVRRRGSAALPERRRRGIFVESQP